MVILGIASVPNTKLAKEPELELGFRGTIKVDRYMRSYYDPGVFACGDCAEKPSFFYRSSCLSGVVFHIKLKMVHAKDTGALLGGSIYSEKSVDKMVNMLTACIMHKMTDRDIVKIRDGNSSGIDDFSYSLPYH